MTKGELIESLKDFPDDMEIVKNGHPDGGYFFNKIYETKLVSVYNHYLPSWRGDYKGDEPIDKFEMRKVIYLD